MEDLIHINITGKVINQNTQLPLLGVAVKFLDITTYSDKAGIFSLKLTLKNNLYINYQLSAVKPDINLNIKEYTPLSKTPFTSEGDIKNNMGVIELTPSNEDIELEKIKSSQLSESNVATISKSNSNPSAAPQKALNKTLISLKTILIPTVITLLASFGISNALKYLKNKDISLNPQCPPEDQLNILINKRNKLVTQLNNLYFIINSTLVSLSILEGTILTFQGAFKVLKFAPIPTPPPGLPSLVPPIQDLKPTLEKNIAKLESLTSGTILILTTLRETLQNALDLLSLLDEQIQKCSSNANLDEVNNELLKLNNQPNNPPVPNEVNGFIFGTETETTSNDLKRRRAIAKNKQGVILLRGEYSYSAMDVILIDELIFHIQTNDLKAD
jgi:hypothetical protein